MLRTLLREVLLMGLGLLLLAVALIVYRDLAAEHPELPPLPGEVEGPLVRLEESGGWDRRWVLGGLGLGLTAGLWLLLRLVAPAPTGPAAGAPARAGRLASAAGRRSSGPWLLALVTVSVCAAAIAGLYLAPDTVRVGDWVMVRRMPRDEFLRFLGWGGAALGAAHLVLFVLFAVFGRRTASR